jgi:hypothetical protein
MVRNVPVFVAGVDWIDVITGRKTEYRIYGKANVTTPRVTPCPCIFYTPRANAGPDTALGVLEEQWTEPLGAISGESLELEGFPDDLEGFRRYIALRYPNGGFRPLANVIVRRVRPMSDADQDEWMLAIWEKLYGQYA